MYAQFEGTHALKCWHRAYQKKRSFTHLILPYVFSYRICVIWRWTTWTRCSHIERSFDRSKYPVFFTHPKTNRHRPSTDHFVICNSAGDLIRPSTGQPRRCFPVWKCSRWSSHCSMIGITSRYEIVLFVPARSTANVTKRWCSNHWVSWIAC